MTKPEKSNSVPSANSSTNYIVKPSLEFERDAKRLIKKYPSLDGEITALKQVLAEKPETGTPLGKDCFKIRLAIASKGKGKSGGSRVIYIGKIYQGNRLSSYNL